MLAAPSLVTDARADCTVSSVDLSVINCTGDNAAGISVNNGTGSIRTLNVFNLANDIAPGAGIEGIYFGSDEPVSLFVDMGPWKIVTNAAPGIVAGTLGAGAIDVNVSVSGSIETGGDFAPGILAESIDGSLFVGSFASIATTGGGSSGIHATSFTGPVEVYATGDISTIGASSHGIEAATDGPLTITSLGNISTEGADAKGIFAEDIGGPIFVDVAGSITTKGEDAGGIFVESGGTATIFSSAEISTQGSGAVGLFVDGQNGAIVFQDGRITTSGSDADGIVVTSATGDAGVLMYGSITTSGNNSRGVSATSLGNGTVAVGASGIITTSGSDSDGIWVESDSGLVAIVNAANISTTGEDSDGISAVSGPSGGTPNDVMIMNAGIISATGLYSAGIRAAGRDVSVENYGTVIGGDCCGGVMLGATGQAVVMNYGTIIGQTTGEAVFATGDDVRVENFGTVTGNVLLAAANTSNFFNYAGALFNSGDQVIAGSVVNDGTIAPGGRGAVLMTMMAEDFTQGAGGIYAVDIDPAASTDRNDEIVVSGTADVDGIVEVRMLSLPLTAAETFTILSGMGGLEDKGLSLIASPALHATLFSDATDVVLGIAVDYDVNGLGGNQRSIARYLNRVLGAGAGAASPVLLGLLNVGNLGEYANALDQLSPAVYSNAEIAALYSSLAFSNSLLSCKVNGTDTASIIREGQCLWAGASARFLNTSTTSEQIGSSETAGLFTAGAQVALDDVWRLGVGGGFQSSTLQTATGATSEGSLGQAGVSLKYNPGPLLLAAAVTGGGAKYDTRRVMSFGGFTGTAESDQTLGIFSGAARVAYVLGSPHLYAKPTFDMSVTQLQLGSFTETGSAAALAVEGGGQTVFAAAPSVEVGTEFWLGNGTLVRPLIRLGGVFYSGNDLALTAGFANLGPLNAIPGGSGFTITTDADDAMGLVGAGLDVINGNDAVLRLSYDGLLGETTQIHAVGIKGSARF